MADVINSNDRFIDITGEDGSTAIANDYDCGIGQLWSIIFIPGGDSDELVIKDGADDGPLIAHVSVAADTDLRQLNFFGRSARPYLDVSDCSFSAGARVLLHHET